MKKILAQIQSELDALQLSSDKLYLPYRFVVKEKEEKYHLVTETVEGDLVVMSKKSEAFSEEGMIKLLRLLVVQFNV